MSDTSSIWSLANKPSVALQDPLAQASAAQSLKLNDLAIAAKGMQNDYTAAVQPGQISMLQQSMSDLSAPSGQPGSGAPPASGGSSGFGGTGAAGTLAAPTIHPDAALASVTDPQARSMIGLAAAKQGLPPEALPFWIASLHNESGGSPRLNLQNGAAGEIGPGQIMPATGAGLGYTPDQLRNPATNLEASAKYFGQQWQRSGGDGMGALRGYNGGNPGNMKAQGYAVAAVGRMNGWGGASPDQAATNAVPQPPSANPEPSQQDDTARAAVRQLSAQSRYYMALPDGKGARAAAAIQQQLDNIAGPGGIVDPRTGNVFRAPGSYATRFAAAQATEAGKIGPQAQLYATNQGVEQQTHAANAAVDTAEQLRRPVIISEGQSLTTPQAVGVGSGSTVPPPPSGSLLTQAPAAGGVPPLSALSGPPPVSGQPGPGAINAQPPPPAAGSGLNRLVSLALTPPSPSTPRPLASLASSPDGGALSGLLGPGGPSPAGPAAPGGLLSLLGPVPPAPPTSGPAYTDAMQNAVNVDGGTAVPPMAAGTFYRVASGPLQVRDPLAGKVPQVATAQDAQSLPDGVVQVGGQYMQKGAAQGNPLAALVNNIPPGGVPDPPQSSLADLAGIMPSAVRQQPADTRFPPAVSGPMPAAISGQGAASPLAMAPGLAPGQAPLPPPAQPAAPAPSLGDQPGTYTAPYTGGRTAADEEAKRLTAVQGPVIERAQESQNAMNRIGQARAAVAAMTAGGIPPGYFSPELAKAAAAAQALGINLPALGIDPAAISNQQVANEAMTQIAGQMLRQIFPQRVTDTDTRVYGEKMLHGGMTGDAINSILNMAQGAAHYDLNKADSMLAWKSGHGGNMAGWEPTFYKEHGYGPDLFNARASGTVPPGPASLGGGQGAPSGGQSSALTAAALPTIMQNNRMVPDASKLQDGQVYTAPSGHRLRFNQAKMTFSEAQ